MDTPFTHYKPSPEGRKKLDTLRQAFKTTSSILRELAPQSRELSLAITNLEQSAMWAIKAVVVHDPESEVAG